jgi:hypothetical protein
MPFPYTSVMIEVNKRVYILRLEYSALKWMRWSGTLRRIYEFIMQEAEIRKQIDSNRLQNKT